MLTNEIKQAWLDWHTQILNNFKDNELSNFIDANDFNLNDNDIISLLNMELVIKFKEE